MITEVRNNQNRNISRHPNDRNGNSSAPSPSPDQVTLSGPEAPFEKNGELYRNFPGRQGYDPSFLGVNLPMPQLDASIKNSAAPLLSDPSQIELKYTHFSTVQNAERRQPMLTAVNIDGAHSQDLARNGVWTLDARMDRKYQLGNEAYANNDIDKGHQVRRRDPIWGQDATQAGNDTFVYTNSGLQHADLNQRTWLDLEDHVLNGAIQNQQKKTVFTGPVFRADDPKFSNGAGMTPTQIPTAFWKVEVWNEPGKGLEGEAFTLSQKDLIGKAKSTQSYNHMTQTELMTHRLPMANLEELTHLHFGAIAEAPPEA